MIESVQKRVGRKFSPEEIETGILKDLITNADYDIIRVVRIFNALHAFECAIEQTPTVSAFRCSIVALVL